MLVHYHWQPHTADVSETCFSSADRRRLSRGTKLCSCQYHFNDVTTKRHQDKMLDKTRCWTARHAAIMRLVATQCNTTNDNDMNSLDLAMARPQNITVVTVTSHVLESPVIHHLSHECLSEMASEYSQHPTLSHRYLWLLHHSISLDNPLSHSLTTPISSCTRPQCNKRSSMFTSKPHTSLRHTVPHNFNILITTFQTNLEVRVASISSKFIDRPSRC